MKNLKRMNEKARNEYVNGLIDDLLFVHHQAECGDVYDDCNGRSNSFAIPESIDLIRYLIKQIEW